MELDASGFPDGTTLETDLCIIGAGPAGLVLAAEFAGQQRDVIVLESGAHRPEPDILDLNDGDVLGDDYAGLRQTRHRQIGGTSSVWNTPVRGSIGAKYAPLEPPDLDARPGTESSGWPLGYDELRTYYERAQRICALGPFAYDAVRWALPGVAPLALAGSCLVSRVYQLGTRHALVAPRLAALRRAGNVRLCTHATVVRLETAGAGTAVARAAVTTPGGPTWGVRASFFVLAAGAVENARLLLTSGDGPEGLGNRSGWVGRCFMEHPRDTALRLVPRSPSLYRDAAFYDVRDAEDGTTILGRLAAAEDAVRAGDLPSASATLLPRLTPAARRAREALGPIARLGAVRRWLPWPGHGWSRHPTPSRVFAGFTVLLNLEQAPHPENRVQLGRRRDALGAPTAELHWRWHTADHQRLERVRAAVARELEAAGAGRVHVDAATRPDPNAHHHAGTTRMSADPRAGVVDPSGRVHSLDNLFVTGASVFPTAGCVNPVLTIVAIALRLADYLKRA